MSTWKIDRERLEEDARLLAAIQGNDKNVEHVLRLLPFEQIDPNINSPRKYIDQDKWQINSLIGLRNSILEQGVLQPILVEPKGDRFQIIFGERRYRAARDLLRSEPGTPHREGLDFSVIPALVLVPGNRRLEIQLAENMHRAGLQNEEIGWALHDLLEQYAGNVSSVARAIGCPPQMVEHLRDLAVARPARQTPD
uniref:ParB-like N-terminal domain-containing protein n=1 Tax=mine drainage metagenome TaxID=410659 RepID=E6QLR7_9ZZZZ